MAKKKKSQLKPVARGFATTSVAKKVEPEPEVDPAEESPAAPGANAGDPSGLSAADNSSTQPDSLSTQFNAQEQALQDLVDKFQDRVEKDITRAIKVIHTIRYSRFVYLTHFCNTYSPQTIEQERRFADTLPHLDLDRVYVDQVLNLVLDESQVRAVRFIVFHVS